MRKLVFLDINCVSGVLDKFEIWPSCNAVGPIFYDLRPQEVAPVILNRESAATSILLTGSATGSGSSQSLNRESVAFPILVSVSSNIQGSVTYWRFTVMSGWRSDVTITPSARWRTAFRVNTAGSELQEGYIKVNYKVNLLGIINWKDQSTTYIYKPSNLYHSFSYLSQCLMK